MTVRSALTFIALTLLCSGAPALAQQQNQFITHNDPRNPVQVDLSVLNIAPPEQAAPKNEIILQPPPPRMLKFRSLTKPPAPAQRPIPAIDRPKPPVAPAVTSAVKPVAKPAVTARAEKPLVTVPPKPERKPGHTAATAASAPPVPEAKPAVARRPPETVTKSVTAENKPVVAPKTPPVDVQTAQKKTEKTEVKAEPLQKPAPVPVITSPALKKIETPAPPPPAVPAKIVLPETKVTAQALKEPEKKAKDQTIPAKPVVAPEKPVAPVVKGAPVPPPAHERVVSPDAKSAFLDKGPKMIRADSAGRNQPKPLPNKPRVSLSFDATSADLNADTASALDSVIASLNESEKLRLQLMAYASDLEGSSSSARRLSLSRALAVRAYLMDHGIRPTRVDVRAMGSETQEKPLDRVDVVFIE